MQLRHSTTFAVMMTVCTAIILAGILHSRGVGEDAGGESRTLAKELHLTDIALFTEARYTRNPALADLHAPFQEHPSALEHFPSGSFFKPVNRITGSDGKH